MSSPELLVVRQSGLGDLLSGLPALRGIRRHFPAHRLRMTCPSWLVPLAARLDVADGLISEDARDGSPVEHELADASMLRSALAGSTVPDVLVVLRLPEREVAEAALERGARLVVAYRHPAVEATAGFPEFSFADHIVVRWERLLAAWAIETRREDLYIGKANSSNADSGPTLIHVGAGSPARRWPAERWAAVAHELEARGGQVLLTGSQNEAELVSRVRDEAGLDLDRDVSATDILQLIELVAAAQLVLSCDTGVAHLAIALRRRSVILFGAVPPAWWGPPPGSHLHRCLWNGRLGEPYAAQPDPGLLSISVEEVLHAALASEGARLTL